MHVSRPHSNRSSIQRSGRRSWMLRAVCIVAALCCLASSSLAQQARPTEAQVKAAYILNFGQFVSWPNDRLETQDSFKICLLGKDPFGPMMESTVSGEQIEGKRITIERLSKMPGNSQCNVLFISPGEEGHLDTILAIARASKILTVSDMPRFAERGGIIGLVSQKDKVRFEVNRLAAEQSHLALSSELLKVAIKVLEKPIPGH
jgi:hypothetical protein